jgi:hypothetical protein
MSTNAIANCIRGHSSLSSETHQSLRMDMQKSSSCFCIHKRLKIPAGCDYASGLLLLKFHKAGPTKKWEWIEMEMAKGKGEESALWISAVPGLRPGTFSVLLL